MITLVDQQSPLTRGRGSKQRLVITFRYPFSDRPFRVYQFTTKRTFPTAAKGHVLPLADAVNEGDGAMEGLGLMKGLGEVEDDCVDLAGLIEAANRFVIALCPRRPAA